MTFFIGGKLESKEEWVCQECGDAIYTLLNGDRMQYEQAIKYARSAEVIKRGEKLLDDMRWKHCRNPNCRELIQDHEERGTLSMHTLYKAKWRGDFYFHIEKQNIGKDNDFCFKWILNKFGIVWDSSSITN